jgi:hypothetical protein
MAFEVRGAGEVDVARAAMQSERIDGVRALADAACCKHRMRIGGLCTKQRLPSV